MYMFTPQEIRAIRLALKLSLREFAERVGAKESAASLWEAGKRHPRFETLVKINALAAEAKVSAEKLTA